MRALVAGWFSYADGHATAGDVLARDLLCEWLKQWGIEHEIAVAPPFAGGRHLDEIDPTEFSHAFFICGPFGWGELEEHFLRKFGHCRLIGLNLSLDRAPDAWNPFDLLIERDSVRETHPDMLFGSRQHLPPLIGVCLVEPHPEADVDLANAAIDRLLARHSGVRVAIDTRLDHNETGLRSENEVEALIARMDILVTTRLHGMVLALKNGVPPLVIDAVPGGGKIRRQCARVGWSNVFGLHELEDDRLNAAWAYSLSEDARADARACADRAGADVVTLRDRIFAELAPGASVERNFQERQSQSGYAAFLKDLPPPRRADDGGAHASNLVARIRKRLGR